MKKRLLSVLLVAVLCLGMSMTSYAAPQITPEEQPPADLTEEELKAFQTEQLKKYYDMPIATNDIKGWPQGPGTYGEAAYAVAENVGKNAGHDYQWFIEQMNARCKELGGSNSNFVNANGLHDENHYTSARDMALIGRELFKHPEFFEIVQTKQYEIPASDTCQQHIFQQKHKMLQPDNSNYYEYAIGGKTGYTSDALSTLITMADNGNLKLVCVVLRTHGKNIYPDTTNLFNYAFDNFQKIAIKDQETSEDISEILEDASGENCGYVVVPKGVEFSDLDMEMKVDKENNDEAVLTYTYEGSLVGSARAKVSEKYKKEHTANIKKQEKNSDKNSDNKEDASGKKSLTKKLIIVFIAVLLLLVLLFIIRLIQYRRRMKRKRRRRRRRR